MIENEILKEKNMIIRVKTAEFTQFSQILNNQRF